MSARVLKCIKVVVWALALAAQFIAVVLTLMSFKAVLSTHSSVLDMISCFQLAIAGMVVPAALAWSVTRILDDLASLLEG